MSGIEIVAYGDVFLKQHPDDVVVHIGIFVIDGDAGRKHIAHNHAFRRMSGNGLVVAGRIAALPRLGDADKLVDVGLLVMLLHFVVTPVVHHSTHH